MPQTRRRGFDSSLQTKRGVIPCMPSATLKGCRYIRSSTVPSAHYPPPRPQLPYGKEEGSGVCVPGGRSLHSNHQRAMANLFVNPSVEGTGDGPQSCGQAGRPTGQPTNQPANQPTSWPTDRPTGQPTNQPANQPANQLINQPTNQLAGRTNQPTNQPTN